MIELKFCTVEYRSWGCVTRFQDGAEITAFPHEEMPHYHVIAHRLGYGDDLLGYCREHEVCHSLVEQFFHDRPSRTLWALAHGSMLSGLDAAYEENMAQTLQRFLRANERPILGGVAWDDLRGQALRVLS